MKRIFFAVAALAVSASVCAGEMPFIEATKSAAEVPAALNSAGFEVVGEYNPYANVRVIAFTSAALKAAASKTEFGGYAAALRVALTDEQVSYNNPGYVAAMYRLDGDLAEVQATLTGALGDAGQFGAEKERADKDLRNYHFMAFMPYFDDHKELASFPSHAEAVSTVDKNLQNNTAGASKVYQVEVNEDTTLIGFAVSEGDGADKTVMDTVKTSAAHLPYEMLIKGGKAYLLHPKFRIAMSAPDLSMGSFMTIMNAPDAIIDVGKALTR